MKKLLLLALLFGCQQAEIPPENTLRIAISHEPSILDPRICGTKQEQMVTKALYEGLTRMSPGDEPTLAIAESFELSPDGKHYTFHLKETVWSDGTPLTAHDFEYAWKTLLSPHFGTSHAEYLYPILNAQQAVKGLVSTDEIGVKAIDDYTLAITLEHPTPYFLESLANPLYSPVSEKRPRATNGPFMVQKWDRDQALTLRKNPRYWDQETVSLNYVVIAFVPDANTAFTLFQQGKIDWGGDPFFALPPEIIANLKEKDQLGTLPINCDYRIAINVERYPFTSKKIRQALSYATDRQAIVNHVLVGEETPSTSILTPGLSLHDTPLFQDHNIAYAQTLFEEGLEELGISKEEFPAITLSYRLGYIHKNIAQVLQQQWQDNLGIKVKLSGLESGTFVATVLNREPQLAGFYWYSVFNDPTYNLNIMTSKENKLNSSAWEDAHFTALLDQAEQEVDLEKRNHLMKEAEALVAEEMPVIPICTSNYTYAKQSRVKNLYVSSFTTDFKWIQIKD